MAFRTFLLGAAASGALLGNAALAQNAPQDLLPPERPAPQSPPPSKPSVDQAFGDMARKQPGEVVQALPAAPKPILATWTVAQARELASFAEGIGAEGLNPKDYKLAELHAAIAGGEGAALNSVASLSFQYLVTNIPEQKLRLTVNNRIIKSYRTIVGKPGRTATPQLAEMVEAVIYNPTWTVPQSIVKGEGLGAKVMGIPGWARANGYKGSRGENGFITVVQQPGPNNSLGLMKLDMPNEHAIFLHDTPARGLFAQESRALSHGCVRVENARELAMTMSMLGNMKTKDDIPAIQAEVQAITAGREYTRYPLTNQWPVYLTYFTMASDVDGKMRSFADIYGRDAPVLASFDKPRQSNRARKTDEAVVEIVDDLKTT